MNSQKDTEAKSKILFIVCSLIGVVLFLVPMPINGVNDLVIAFLADSISAVVKPFLPYALAAIFSGGCILAIIHRVHPIKMLNESPLLKESFTFTDAKLFVRVLGTVLFIMVAFNIGPEIITSSATGGTMYSLMITLTVWHFLSFYLFSFLMDFGAMDFVGTLIKKIMRPLFTLPGNSAIDCMASWVGNGPFGVIITKLQYKEGYYTKRESAVVASCFSIVSISFCLIVAKTLNIVNDFVPYYLSITVTTLLCSIILPRIWPLNKIADTYNPDAPVRYDFPEKGSLWKQAITCGAQKAGEADFKHIMQRSSQTAIDFFLTVFPVMMASGTVLLIISEYTPVVSILSAPIKGLLELLMVPEAEKAAPAILIGFVDMFLPAVVGSTIESEFTRFIIGSVSIGQLIYMTETGAIILKNRDIFDLPLWKLAVLFIFRSVIALPVALITAFIIF